MNVPYMCAFSFSLFPSPSPYITYLFRCVSFLFAPVFISIQVFHFLWPIFQALSVFPLSMSSKQRQKKRRWKINDLFVLHFGICILLLYFCSLLRPFSSFSLSLSLVDFAFRPSQNGSLFEPNMNWSLSALQMFMIPLIPIILAFLLLVIVIFLYCILWNHTRLRLIYGEREREKKRLMKTTSTMIQTKRKNRVKPPKLYCCYNYNL